MARQYSAVECYLFKDTRFLALSDKEKLTWLYLLGHSSRVRCPGLVEGSQFSIAQFLWYPLKTGDAKKLEEALKSSKKSIKKLVRIGWLEHDLKSGLFFLPKAVTHNLPDNENMVWSWLRNLKEFPSSPLVRRWVSTTFETVKKAFGRDDPRCRLMRKVGSSLTQFGKLDVSGYLARNVETDEAGNTVKDEELSGYYDGYPQGVKDGLVECVNKLFRNKKEISKQARAPIKATAQPGKKKKPESKSTEPPDTFTARQKKLWSLFLTEKFRVPGVGQQTIFENTANPKALCEKLGGAGFLNVDLDVIYRLATWSFDPKNKAKKDLGRQLLNIFARDEKQGKEKRRVENEQATRIKNRQTFDASDIPAEPTDEEKQARVEAMIQSGFIKKGDKIGKD